MLAKCEQLLVQLLCVCHCLCLRLLSQSVGVCIISQEVVSVAVQSCIRQLVRTMLACSLAKHRNVITIALLPITNTISRQLVGLVRGHCFLLSIVDY